MTVPSTADMARQIREAAAGIRAEPAEYNWSVRYSSDLGSTTYPMRSEASAREVAMSVGDVPQSRVERTLLRRRIMGAEVVPLDGDIETSDPQLALADLLDVMADLTEYLVDEGFQPNDQTLAAYRVALAWARPDEKKENHDD